MDIRASNRTGTGRLAKARRLSEIPRRLAFAAALGMTGRGVPRGLTMAELYDAYGRPALGGAKAEPSKGVCDVRIAERKRSD